jgi:putative long chain acyl-CoA synthase
VRLGRFDLDRGELVRGPDGHVVPAAAGELGLMLAQDAVGLFAEAALTDVFAPGDTWQPTTSLFRRDPAGDYWLEGMLHEIVRPHGTAVLPGPVAAVFEELPNVTSAVAYARRGKRGEEVLCVAVSVTKDLGPAALTSAAYRLPEAARPAIVHVLPEMPFSSAGKPASTAVAGEPIDLEQPAWRWDSTRDEYRSLTKTAMAGLLRR